MKLALPIFVSVFLVALLATATAQTPKPTPKPPTPKPPAPQPPAAQPAVKGTPKPLGIKKVAATSSPCHQTRRVVSVKIAGKDIKQELLQLDTVAGCKWILAGGKRDSYVDATSCSKCSRAKSGQGVVCSGPPQGTSRTCKLVRGPDCRSYQVDPKDNSKPCK